MFQIPLSVLSLTATAVAAATLVGADSARAVPSVTSTSQCHGLRATIVGDGGADVLRGTAGRDVIAGLGGADRITGGGGDDVICGGPGVDYVLGGRGEDRMYGGPGADTVQSQAGDRAFLGRGGDTGSAQPGGRLRAGKGRDWVIADPRADVRLGSGGDALDINRTGPQPSGQPPRVIFGGRGIDVVRVLGMNEGDAVMIDLQAGIASSGDTSGRIAGFENATGDLSEDVLIGDDGPNVLLGYYGEDRITAGGGDDVVDGQEDPDTLDGGEGNDRCSEEMEPGTSCESILEPPARRP